MNYQTERLNVTKERGKEELVYVRNGVISKGDLTSEVQSHFFDWIYEFTQQVTESNIVPNTMEETVTIYNQIYKVHVEVVQVLARDLGQTDDKMIDMVKIYFRPTEGDTTKIITYGVSIPIDGIFGKDDHLYLEISNEDLIKHYKILLGTLLSQDRKYRFSLPSEDVSFLTDYSSDIALLNGNYCINSMIKLGLQYNHYDLGLEALDVIDAPNNQLHLISEKLTGQYSSKVELLIFNLHPIVTNSKKGGLILGVHGEVTVATVDKSFVEQDYTANKVFTTPGVGSITQPLTVTSFQMAYPRSDFFNVSYDVVNFFKNAKLLSKHIKEEIIDHLCI